MSVVGAPLDLITVVKPCVGKLEEVLTWAVDPDNTDLRLWRRVTFDAHGNVVELDLSDCDLDMDLETLAETLIISERLRVLKLSNNPKLTGDIGCFEGCQFTEVWLGGCIQITGDIGIFSTSPELTDLSLGAPSGGITGLTGDVAVLLDMPSLRRVWLHGALNLTGDIGAALEGKRYLVWFFCTACTKLTGSLVSFRTCPSLVSSRRYHTIVPRPTQYPANGGPSFILRPAPPGTPIPPA
mmetsp:Transcript_88903/g.254162  ORF Transcript_88903/g.254162 Transcript_88903/m.254162 type:complete len:240 (-) Transcript_88903:467-1186(-)